MEVWDDNAGEPITETDLSGRTCFSGLDLSTTTDITALVHVFPTDDDSPWPIIARFWMPEENIALRVKRDRVPYDVWARSGLLSTTEGNVMDYDAVRQQLRRDSELFDVRQIGFDPWNATQLATQLAEQDGLPMLKIPQGYAHMSEPSKQLDAMLLDRGLRHGAHPILRWMAGNVSIKTDPAGNIKPDKGKSTERIDGIVALVIALGRAMVPADSGRSKYEAAELLVV
jgi:phage terminase large subunit-like protein